MGCQFMNFTRKSDNKRVSVNVDHIQMMEELEGGGTRMWFGQWELDYLDFADDFDAVGQRHGWGRRHD